jgi:hypothetical protein
MRPGSIAFLAALLELTAPAYVAAGDESRALIDRAIQAIGGADRLSHLKAASWETRAKFEGLDRDGPSHGTLHGQLPGQFRLDSVREENGKKVTYTRLLRDGKGWFKRGDQVREMDAKELTHAQRTFFQKQVAMTLIPLRGKAFTVKSLGKTRVGEQDAVGVRVRHPAYGEMDLFFDVKSGLLVMSRAPGEGKEGATETRYGDYKEFHGLRLATRMNRFRDGRQISEWELIDFRPVDRLDPRIFEKP